VEKCKARLKVEELGLLVAIVLQRQLQEENTIEDKLACTCLRSSTTAYAVCHPLYLDLCLIFLRLRFNRLMRFFFHCIKSSQGRERSGNQSIGAKKQGCSITHNWRRSRTPAQVSPPCDSLSITLTSNIDDQDRKTTTAKRSMHTLALIAEA